MNNQKEILSKELIKMRKNHNDSKQQVIRKQIEKSSRLLDGYYNPKIHPKKWQSGGQVNEKNKYIYDESGLVFNISQTNSKSTFDNSSLKSKEQKHFLEFDYLENNDILIVIEYCSNCEEHMKHTQHINDIYKHFSRLLQNCINIRFPFIRVILKPVVKEDLPNRLGAMEIQIGYRYNDNTTIETLFSKLNSNIWPNFHMILNKIGEIVPIFNLKCVLYDDDEGVETESNYNNNDDNENNGNNNIEKNNNLIPTQFQNIKVNLYSFVSEQIELNCYEASDALAQIYNPKRKLFEYSQMLENGMIEKNNINNNNNINYNKSKINTMTRPYTSRPLTTTNVFNKSSMTSYNNNNNNNTLKNINNSKYSTTSKKDLEFIENQDVLNNIKGKLLSSGYTDKNGVLIFENVPYDTYVLEIENNKNFLACGSLLQFNKIIISQSQNGEIYTLNKLFGLKRQIDSYLEVFVYLNKNNNENDIDNEFDMELIDDAKVSIKRKFYDGDELYSGNEDVFELKKNENIKGRYEIITTPGLVEIIVFKVGFEEVCKEVNLKCGENKINIELM
jgi:hypothetical protein